MSEKSRQSSKSNIADLFCTLVDACEGEWAEILAGIYRDRSKPRSKDIRLDR
jgi:hypothetical protein